VSEGVPAGAGTRPNPRAISSYRGGRRRVNHRPAPT